MNDVFGMKPSLAAARVGDVLPKDFIILSSIDWSRNWQMHQQLATSLVDAGHRVLFVENTGVRAPRAGDFSRIRNRIRNWIKSTRGFSDVRENLTVFSPLILPFPYLKLALWINRFLLGRAISKWMRVNRFHAPVLISFLPTPLAQRLIDDIDPVGVVYYCANDMAGGSAGAASLRRHEEGFMRRADAVFCISQALLERARQFNPRVFLFPAGVDFAKFHAARDKPVVPADIAALARPRVGYVGSVGAVFDQALLVRAAREMPHVSFVLIGPESADVSRLRACPNVHLLGPRPHDAVPHYIHAFDVALIPYVRNTFTDAVYSCKLNEYLAMGAPVVATDLREVRLYAERHPGTVCLAASAEDFIAQIKAALEAQDEWAAARRINAAKANGWDQRFADITAALARTIAEKSAQSGRWQDRLSGVYHRGRVRLVKTLAAGLAIYAGLFHTPALWWAGEQLVVRERPQPADAIVVFSGDGEAGYVNTSYQKRAADAFRLYRAGYADKIILSSGKRGALRETEVIRAILLEQGVPAHAITLVPGEPASTYENVRLASQTLRSLGVHSALFVTAPYHSRRATRVWQKLAPDITLTVPQTLDAPSPDPVWGVSAKTAGVIAFECLAIAHYAFRGWL